MLESLLTESIHIAWALVSESEKAADFMQFALRQSQRAKLHLCSANINVLPVHQL